MGGGTSLGESFASARKTFDLVADVRTTAAAVADFIPGYGPLHREVRALQVQVSIRKNELKVLERRYRRLSRDASANEESLTLIDQRIGELNAEVDDLQAQVPEVWDSTRKDYLTLADAENKARRSYRRNVDDAYEPVAALRQMIAQAEPLAALRDRIQGLGPVIRGEPFEQAMETIKTVGSAVGAIDGVSHITSKLSKARRALRGDEPDREKAAAQLAEGLQLFDAEVAWRQRAQSSLAAGLDTYDDAIKSTIGLRLQERLTSDQAEEIADCMSYHRDISLAF